MQDIREIRRRNLIRILREKGIKPADLVRKVGCNKNFINQLMSLPESSSHKNIGEKTLNRLAEALEVDKSEFHRDPDIVQNQQVGDDTESMMKMYFSLPDKDREVIKQTVKLYYNRLDGGPETTDKKRGLK